MKPKILFLQLLNYKSDITGRMVEVDHLLQPRRYDIFLGKVEKHHQNRGSDEFCFIGKVI
jgi:hypothetical protein